MRRKQDWSEMREGIIGLGEESSRRSFYPELMDRLAELERAQAEITRSQENLWTVFNSMSDAMIIHDLEGRILEVNDAMLAMFGLVRGMCRNYTVLDLTAAPEGREATWARLAELWSRPGDSANTSEWKVRRPLAPEETFEVEVSLRRGRWYEQEVFIAVLRDISERKRLEARLNETQKLEAMGQLAGGIAHDTNNMLAVILGWVDLLLETPFDPGEFPSHLNRIRKAALNSTELIRQLLAFARRQPIQPVVADLNLLVDGTQRMLGRLIGEQYALRWRPAQGLWPVRMDPTQVDQILTNLLLNARDAVRPGDTITIETANLSVDAVYAQAHPDAAEGDYTVLVVSDTGQGMPPEVVEKIFEPFFTTKAMGRGTGLGLATVYGIVRQNHGFITVYSVPGKGTSFRVHFPRFLDEGAATEAAAEARAPVGTETILLVEDEESLLELGRNLLESAGYRVAPMAHPLEALRWAEEGGHFDLLATDLVMPGMNGRELHDKLSAKRPGLKTLFLSGYPAGAIDLDRLPGEGCGFLQKPFTRTGLLQAVRRVLDRA